MISIDVYYTGVDRPSGKAKNVVRLHEYPVVYLRIFEDGVLKTRITGASWPSAGQLCHASRSLLDECERLLALNETLRPTSSDTPEQRG